MAQAWSVASSQMNPSKPEIDNFTNFGWPSGSKLKIEEFLLKIKIS